MKSVNQPICVFADLTSTLSRIRRELRFSVSQVEEEETASKNGGEDSGKQTEGDIAGERWEGLQQVIREFHDALQQSEKYDKAFTIIIDGLNKFDAQSETGKVRQQA